MKERGRLWRDPELPGRPVGRSDAGCLRVVFIYIAGVRAEASRRDCAAAVTRTLSPAYVTRNAAVP